MAVPSTVVLSIPEILFMILSCGVLSPTELALSTGLVNRTWLDLSQRALWQSLELDADTWEHPYYNALLEQLESRGSYVRTLTLKECGTDGEKFCALLGKMPSLQTLFVDRVMLYNRTSMLMEFLEQASLRGLRCIRLPHISSTSHGIERMLALCRLNPGIQHWELMDSDIDDRALLTLTETCSRIKSLDLSRNEMITFKGFFDNIGNSHVLPEQELTEDQEMLLLESRSGYFTAQDDPELGDEPSQDVDMDNFNELLKSFKSSVESEAVAFPEGATGVEGPSSSPNSNVIAAQSKHKRRSTSSLTFDAMDSQPHSSPYSECFPPKQLHQLLLQHQQQQCDTMPQEPVSFWACKQSIDQEKSHQNTPYSQRLHPQQRRISHHHRPQKYRQPPHLDSTGPTRCRSKQPNGQEQMYYPTLPKKRRRSVCPTSRLLENESTLEHLEELSLVFCLGIANTEFQALFRALQGKSLRTLDLQFTNIEDSALETLASSFSYGGNKNTRTGAPLMTHINLSYCNKITARGILALVERCPQLQELQFLSCDLVSAECFHGQLPWVCTRLKRLEFTLQPRILFTTTSNQEETHKTGHQGQMDDMYQPEQLVLTQQYQDDEYRLSDKPCSQTRTKTQSYEELLESVQEDFNAMFRQLRQLSSLQALHLYNSPALNSFLNAHVGTSMRRRDSKMPAAAWTQQSVTSTSGLESPSQGPALFSNNTEVDGNRMIDGDSSSARDDAEEPSQKFTGDSHYESNSQASSSDVGHPLDQASLRSTSSFAGSPVVDRVFPVSEVASIAALHPFSLQTGFGAIQKLKQLQTLSLYERSNVVFGAAEARWIAKSLPLLSSFELRGSIEIEAGVKTRLQRRHPQIQVQVCSLF